jgi:uncharacterized metal-binding protein YceD (DUF177 family)
MLTISIKGLTDGKYPIEATIDCSELPHISEEFFGTLSVRGTIRKHDKRYLLDLQAEVSARLFCDVSGEEYEEHIQAECSLEYVANTMLANLHTDRTDAEPPYYIREDDMTIDISDEIRQEMAINLPLKRVAPAYRDKEFSEVFPKYAENDVVASDTDPRWAALKTITFDK